MIFGAIVTWIVFLGNIQEFITQEILEKYKNIIFRSYDPYKK